MSTDEKNKVAKVTKEINSLPPEMQKQVVTSVAFHSGPIPDAEQFRKYEDVLPGSADRILKMAEAQSSHRRSIEAKVIEADIRSRSLGQTFAFIIAITVVIGSLVLIVLGRSVEGFSALLIALGTLVGIFIYGKNSEQKERTEKANMVKNNP